MDECDQIENELERMLNTFRDAVALLSNPPPDNPNLDQDMKNLSRQIVESSKNIDNILNTTRLFDQTEEELDDKLKQMDEDNRYNQDQFVHVKASTGKRTCI